MKRHITARKLLVVGATASLAVAYFGAMASTSLAKHEVPRTFAASQKAASPTANSVGTIAGATGTTVSSGSTLSIVAPQRINAIEGTEVDQQLTASGGDGSLQWSLSSDLPWLQISANGTLFGVPSSPGNGQATITVTDASGASSQRTIPVSVDLPSGNWSGYIDYSPYGIPFTSASAQFIVPQISSTLPQSCSDEESGGLSLSCSLAEWVGIGGTSGNDTLIQAGVYEIPDLATGTVSIVPWVENLPAPSQAVPNMKVSPGDDIQVSVDQLGGTEWQVTVHDLTTGQSVSGVGNYYGSGDSADFIVEAPTTSAGQTAPTPFASPIKFFDVKTSSMLPNSGQVMVPTAMVQSAGVATYPGDFHVMSGSFDVYYNDSQSI